MKCPKCNSEKMDTWYPDSPHILTGLTCLSCKSKWNCESVIREMETIRAEWECEIIDNWEFPEDAEEVHPEGIKNYCNRHSNCFEGLGECCTDSCCEDCFGS